MKFLAEMSIAAETVARLRGKGHDVVHLRDAGLQRATDAQVAALAFAEERIVLTMDPDFAYLLAAGGERQPSVVLLRLSDEGEAGA